MKKAAYTTLQGERLNLKKLTERQRQLLQRFYKLYHENCDYPDFFNKANSDDSLKAMSAPVCNGCGNSDRRWIDQKVANSIIYQLLNDLADRLAIKQGFLRMGKNSDTDFAENEKVLKEFLNRPSV